MKPKRKHSTFIHRLFCLLMALHVLNVSIDSPDRNSSVTLISNQSEDLSINDIESLGELLLEECLGITVPEHDDPDEDSAITKLGQDYFFTATFVFAPLLPLIRFLLPEFTLFNTVRIPAHVLDILSPPPQLVG